MSDEAQEDPKLIIDEDWKEQVQREKEMAAKGAMEGSDGPSSDAQSPSSQSTGVQETGASAISDSTEDEPGSSDAGDDAATDVPPATFEFLISMLATQAMVALGQFPGPSGKMEAVQKPIAKHYIDLLGILEEKTKGNLETHEQKLLDGMLHQLRMAFVQS